MICADWFHYKLLGRLHASFFMYFRGVAVKLQVMRESQDLTLEQSNSDPIYILQVEPGFKTLPKTKITGKVYRSYNPSLKNVCVLILRIKYKDTSENPGHTTQDTAFLSRDHGDKYIIYIPYNKFGGRSAVFCE